MAQRPLAREFTHLAEAVRALIGLLEAQQEGYWASQLTRSLKQIDAHQLSGATFVLGCYGGSGTLSDLMIARNSAGSDPATFARMNAELTQLRTRVFDSANTIASRKLW